MYVVELTGIGKLRQEERTRVSRILAASRIDSSFRENSGACQDACAVAPKLRLSWHL